MEYIDRNGGKKWKLGEDREVERRSERDDGDVDDDDEVEGYHHHHPLLFFYCH